MMRPGSSRVLRCVAVCVSAVRMAENALHGLGHEQRAVGEALRDVAGGLQRGLSAPWSWPSCACAKSRAPAEASAETSKSERALCGPDAGASPR